MGEVYRAKDTKLKRDVALKVLPDAFANNTERMARFQREAEVLASLNHPNIAHIYSIEERTLVMELVEGETVKGPLPLATALNFARQIAEALEAAHEKGITHRDLKPANIMVTPAGVTKVLDFGLAVVSLGPSGLEPDPGNSPTLTISPTRTGMILGTAAYMSPEQARGRPVDKRADIWAFGVVLYEMLTGRPLFAGETVSDTLASVLKTDPDWNALPPATPEPVRRLLRRCLQRDRKRRLRDIGDALAEIDEAQAGLDAPPGSPPVRRERRLSLGIAAALAIAVVSAVALFLVAPRDEKPVLRLHIDPPEGGQFVFGLGFTPGGLSISPDGRTAAYVAVGKGKAGLWVQSLDSGTARLIAGTEDASFPFWSPDSKTLAFFAGAKLQRLDLAGGAPLKICDLQTGGIAGAAWSSDGYILIAIQANAILRVPAAGGSATPLTNRPGLYPQILPGGRFLYWSGAGKPEEKGVYVASLANPGKPPHLLTTETNALYTPGGDRKNYLLFMRGTTLFAQELDLSALKLTGEPHPVADPVASTSAMARTNAAVSTTGLLLYGVPRVPSQFKWMDRTGRVQGLVGEPGEFNSFRLSPDGRTAALVRVDSGGNSIWLLDTGRGVINRFTGEPSVHTYPVWSPDQETLMFSSSFRGSPALFRKRLSGTGSEERLTQPPGTFNLATDWSQDGRFLLYFDFAAGTQEDMWYLRVPPEGKPVDPAEMKPYLRTTAREANGRFSPEADPAVSPRWVAYQSDESGRFEVYVDSFPQPRRKVRVSISGGQFPEWGPAVGKNERELYYVSPDYKLIAVNLKLSADSVEALTPRELFPLPAEVSTWSPYQVTADGQRFLVLATPEREPPRPLTVVVTWPTLLQKKATVR